jgi:hypothetical protein
LEGGSREAAWGAAGFEANSSAAAIASGPPPKEAADQSSSLMARVGCNSEGGGATVSKARNGKGMVRYEKKKAMLSEMQPLARSGPAPQSVLIREIGAARQANVMGGVVSAGHDAQQFPDSSFNLSAQIAGGNLGAPVWWEHGE